MATYCIADLHGRHDLFKELLTKIQFNHQSDTLYLLGDAIDHEYGIDPKPKLKIRHQVD